MSSRASPPRKASSLPPGKPMLGRIDEEKTRLQIEQEFVEMLGNPALHHFLAENGHLNDPHMITYLEYLLYWKNPEYLRLIRYKICLQFLDALLDANFREALLTKEKPKSPPDAPDITKRLAWLDYYWIREESDSSTNSSDSSGSDVNLERGDDADLEDEERPDSPPTGPFPDMKIEAENLRDLLNNFEKSMKEKQVQERNLLLATNRNSSSPTAANSEQQSLMSSSVSSTPQLETSIPAPPVESPSPEALNRSRSPLERNSTSPEIDSTSAISAEQRTSDPNADVTQPDS